MTENESNNFHRQQHEDTTRFIGQITEAVEVMKDTLRFNTEEHKIIRGDIAELKTKESFNAGKWAGIGIAAGASTTIIAILLKGLSYLKYALGQ